MSNRKSDRWAPVELERRLGDLRRRRIDLSDGGPDSDMARGRAITDDVINAVEGLSEQHGFPKVIKGQSFGAGSFGRRTQAQPLDDIDIFIPLSGAGLRMEDQYGTPTDEALQGEQAKEPLGCEPSLGNGVWLDSAKLLDRIVPSLCEHLALAPRSDCGKNRRGRCAHLTYNGVNVDLVFVLWAEHPRIDRYLLPCGTSWRWKASNPKDDQHRLSAANKHHGGLLLPTIRCMKAWNDHACGGRLKSVHLEVLLAEHILGDDYPGKITSTVGAITYALEALPDYLNQSCADPTGLGDDLDVNLAAEERSWVQQRASQDAQRMKDAIELSFDDPDAAIGEVEAILLTQEPEPSSRDRENREPRHDSEVGQPAQRCNDDERDRLKSINVPPFRAEDCPTQPSDQTGRSGRYG